MLLKFLHLSSVFYVDREHSSLRVSYKELPLSLIKANTSDVSSSQVSKDRDKFTCAGIPNLNALRMSRDECIEDWIVNYRYTCLIISQMMICRLIVVIEHESSSSSNDSLRIPCDSEGVDLIQGTIEGLNSSEGSDVPNPEHTGEIS
jgi:hypothetical protein